MCVCVCGFQKQLPLPAHMTGEVKGRIGGKEDEERKWERSVELNNSVDLSDQVYFLLFTPT